MIFKKYNFWYFAKIVSVDIEEELFLVFFKIVIVNLKLKNYCWYFFKIVIVDIQKNIVGIFSIVIVDFLNLLLLILFSKLLLLIFISQRAVQHFHRRAHHHGHKSKRPQFDLIALANLHFWKCHKWDPWLIFFTSFSDSKN